MERTEVTFEKLLAALPSAGYDLGVLSKAGMYRMENASHSRTVRMIPFLKRRNFQGAHIYLRPTGESSYTLLDDLNEQKLSALSSAGYGPAAVVETSPGNFQAWLRHSQPLDKEMGTLAAKVLAVEFGADGSAADWRRFGRVPGFVNPKPKYQNAVGQFPFARLICGSGLTFPTASAFYARLISLHHQIAADLARQRQAFDSRSRHVTKPASLIQFRQSPRYEGRPAAADMAFCIAAYSQGLSEAEMENALVQEYLSRNNSLSRRTTYIRRTIAKAIRWTI
jgi:hypothetical protein